MSRSTVECVGQMARCIEARLLVRHRPDGRCESGGPSFASGSGSPDFPLRSHRPNMHASESLVTANVSRRAGIVLDPFGGSGTTLIAAQKSGRRARLIEYDPSYCDVILRRFEAVTGTSAILAWTGQTFEDRAAERAPPGISDDPSSQESTAANGKEAQ
jgi:hypothetical protein